MTQLLSYYFSVTFVNNFTLQLVLYYFGKLALKPTTVKLPMLFNQTIEYFT